MQRLLVLYNLHFTKGNISDNSNSIVQIPSNNGSNVVDSITDSLTSGLQGGANASSIPEKSEPEEVETQDSSDYFPRCYMQIA